MKRIFDRMQTVPDQPGQGRRLSEYEGDLEYREVFVHRWRVLYRVEPQDVIVVAVIHGARLLQSADPYEA